MANGWFTDPTNLTAISTAVIAAFTIVLAIATIVQGSMTRTAINLARHEFLVTHRPKLRVRFVHGPEPTDDSKWAFKVYLANIGDTIATVKSFSFTAYVIDDSGKTQLEIVPVGKGILPIEVGAGVLMQGTVEDWTAIDSVFSNILVTGRVVYEDGRGASRITAFAREKVKSDDHFHVSEKYGADEYED
jgi:hypothetical protein